MTNIELLKLLIDKKVADSFQFFTSCQYKINMAELSCNALNNLVEKYQSEEADIVNTVTKEALENGVGRYKAHNNAVDFFGIEIDTTVAIEKLFMEIMGLLHNFFDTFAQWINSSLFGEKALPLKKASLVKVIEKMSEFPEYTGQFITNFLDITNNDNYIYISDFNNTQKHRYQLYVQNKFDLLAVEGDLSVPNFSKDGRIHLKTDAMSIIIDSLNYCKNLLLSSQDYIENYYTNHNCNYVEHRIYNPKTYLFFENEADYQQMKNVKNHYHYIEVDENCILSQYQIMLVCDRTSCETTEKSIEMYNSTYPIIMLKDTNKDKIIGILKPEDEENFSFGDAHNLIYRQYKSITSDYQHEMFLAICEGVFYYYPYLSDGTIMYEIDKTNAEESK